MLLVNSLIVLKKKLLKKPFLLKNLFLKNLFFVKTEKPLIDLPSQREKVMFKTSQSKVLEEVPSVLTFKLESIFSTISRVLD